MQIKKDYARTVYDKTVVPLTTYPEKLINFLIKKYSLKNDSKLLELGPARGDFLKEFSKKTLKFMLWIFQIM